MPKGRQRTQKWYLQNENEVMKELGFKPAKGSGNGWIEKEDGENDHVIAQLKSTDAKSYKVTQLDLEKLEYHADLAHKLPMFIIQFLNNDSRYALVNIDDIPFIAEYIKTGGVANKPEPTIVVEELERPPSPNKKIKSSANARKKFNEQKAQEWENRKWRK